MYYSEVLCFVLAFEEVLTKNNTNNRHKNARDTNKTGKEEQGHIFRIVAFNEANEKSDKSGEENHDVVHEYIIVRFCLLFSESSLG